jgi:hypothetical protein
MISPPVKNEPSFSYPRKTLRTPTIAQSIDFIPSIPNHFLDQTKVPVTPIHQPNNQTSPPTVNADPAFIYSEI